MRSSYSSTLCYVLSFFTLFYHVSGFPYNQSLLWDGHSDGVSLSKRAGDFYLRVMPLGASITFGYQSTDGNGYRKWIRDQLRFAEWEVNMVGSFRSGDMNDNDVEAVSGYVIDQVAGLAENTIPKQPNLILINAGTNDMTQNLDVGNAPSRMSSLLDRLFNAIPGTTIVLSTLLPNADNDANNRLIDYNAKLRDMVSTRRGQGQKIILADMNTGFITLSDIVDGTHPTDFGYKKMAAVWWKAIQEADSANFLQKPNDAGFDDSVGGEGYECDKEYGVSRGPVQTQQGSGTDDGGYVHKSENRGVIYSFWRGDDHDIDGGDEDTILADGFWFANVMGSGRDDLLEAYTLNGGVVYYKVHENLGDGKFNKIASVINPHDNCKARGVRWGDLNGDGLDDFFCIGPEGNLYAAINEGRSSDSPYVPTFRHIGQVMTVPSGYSQTNVRLGDIDGDGRIDYTVIGSNGDIHGWRNGGQGYAPTSEFGGYWQDLGIIFTGKGKGDINGMRWVDLNGDHRSDWLWLDDTGKVWTYTNSRGCDKGLGNDWQDAGNTHGGMSTAGARPDIYFGRIFSNVGKASYVWLTQEDDSGGKQYTLRAWINLGQGGTQLKSDGNRYCDMRGTGSDDYVWVGPNGEGTLYANIHSPPNWGQYGVIFNVGVDRKSIQLADFDGDGKCDIASVNKDNGQVRVWRNDYDKNTDKFSFTDLGIFTGSASCTEGWGVGLYDLGLRFADITGDGKADYLCMEKDGRTTGWLNNGFGNFKSVGQVKFSVGKDRANHRWADVNGDGLADFLWMDKFNGDTSVWYNRGQIPASGSAFTWDPQGALYQGPAQGHCMHFPDLGGLGRADFHQVVARTNLAYTWFNECPAAGGDDSASTTDPGLPDPGDITTTPCGKPECYTGEDEWKNWACQDASSANGASSESRWASVSAETAWNAATAKWAANKKIADKPFPEYISEFFGGPSGMSCGTAVDNNGCHGIQLQCGSINSGGGYLVLNSFITLSGMFWNYYDAISRAQTNVAEDVAPLISTFAPHQSMPYNLKIIFDMLQLGAGLVVAPVWNSALKALPFFKANGNTLGTLKDSVNSVTSATFQIAKDLYSQSTVLGQEADLTAAIKDIITGWYVAFGDVSERVFNGEDDNISLLHSFISDGKLLADSYTPVGDPEIRAEMERVLYAMLIPTTWKIAVPAQAPVLIDAGIDCNSDLTDWAYLSSDAIFKTRVCVDNKRYYLVGASGDPSTCGGGDGAAVTCTTESFSELAGQSTLDGSKWGGITAEDISASVVASYKANNNKNGWALNSGGNDQQLSDLYDFSIRAQGVVDIPLCSAEEAHSNWASHYSEESIPWHTYPCNNV